jgi:zinc/manganese transport system permease protein
LYDLAFGPFAEFGFMRRALVGCLALALGCGPIGTFLVIRRMSLMGDALSHAVLPGAALGFILGGLSLPAMSLGGAGAGLVVALLSGLVTRLTPLREDASFAAFYLISLALGVLLVSTHGSNVDLLHLLFGSILAIDNAALVLIGSVASMSLLSLAVIYRPLVVECFDPGFLRAVGGRGGLVHTVFLALVVLNLVAGFQALGTLMAVGLDDAAGRGGPFLGARAVDAQRREQRFGLCLGVPRSPGVISPRSPLGAIDRPRRRPGLFWLGPFRPARQLADALPASPAAGSMKRPIL